MSTERLAYTPAIRPAHDSLNIIVVGENGGKMAFAAEPLQKQEGGIPPAAQWRCTAAKVRKHGILGKKRHAPLFSCAGAGEGV